MTETVPAPRSSRVWWILGLGLVAAWCLYLMLFGPRISVSPPRLEDTGLAQPADYRWMLRDLDDAPVDFARYRGQAVFLNIWATWCAPCREEMPSIESLYNDFKADNDFVVLAVSQDTDGAVVAPFVAQNHFQFTVLLDPRNEVGERYDVNGIPETFIIGRDGRIVAHHVGPYDWSNADIREALQELIKSRQG